MLFQYVSTTKIVISNVWDSPANRSLMNSQYCNTSLLRNLLHSATLNCTNVLILILQVDLNTIIIQRIFWNSFPKTARQTNQPTSWRKKHPPTTTTEIGLVEPPTRRNQLAIWQNTRIIVRAREIVDCQTRRNFRIFSLVIIGKRRRTGVKLFNLKFPDSHFADALIQWEGKVKGILFLRRKPPFILLLLLVDHNCI